MLTYTANTPGEAWRWVCKQFASHGVVVNDTKTIDGIIVTKIKNPTDRIEKNPIYHQSFIDEYKKQFLNPDKKGFEYTYGNRLCQYSIAEGVLGCIDRITFHYNQIDYIINTLKNDKTSRRAMAITWMPWVDEFEKDVPCLQLIKCRILKDKLHMEVIFRSHDMLLGYYPNVLGLSYLMEYMANELDVKRGALTIVSLSPHIYYKRDGDTFRQICKCEI